MWLERASLARRDIAALAATGVGVAELHAAAIGVVARHVGADMSCWATIDPETLGITAMTPGETRIAPELAPHLLEAEHAADEPHTFAALVTDRRPAARLSDLPARERGRSLRVTNVWQPLGIDCELRVPFVVDGRCWGAAGMVRAGHDFTDRETELMLAVAPAVASATRLALRAQAARAGTAGRPAIVVLGAEGEVRAVTAAAVEWRERMDDLAPGWFLLVMRSVSARARAASRPVRSRLGVAGGPWAVLEATALIGDDDDAVAVTIEPVAGEELTGLLMLAYGLSAREREVCREVVAGYPTGDIAAHLFISANTVQDHLKSVFAKVGVHSRGELVAAVRPGLAA